MTSNQVQPERRDGAVGDVEEHASGDSVRDDYVHPTAESWFDSHPCLREIPLFGEVAATYGPRFALSLGLCYVFSKGAGSGIINLSRQPMFMVRFKITATRYQRLASMYSFGWSLKPFIASITDVIAIFGYTKRWYMAMSALFGCAFALAYALLPAKPESANAAAAFVFLVCLCKANIDVLSEGHFSRSMRQKPKSGPAVVSWVWGMTFAGSVISACIMGPLSDKRLTYAGVIIAAGLQFITLFFFVFNMYGEKKNRTNRRMDALLEHEARKHLSREPASKPVEGEVFEPIGEGCAGKPGEMTVGSVHSHSGDASDDDFEEPDIYSCLHDAFEVNVGVAKKNWKLIVYTIIMTCGIITMVCVTVLGTKWQLLYTDIVVAVAFIIGAFLTMPFVIAKATVFIYFNSVLYLQIPGALQNFYLNPFKCKGDFPNFSYVFYQTVGGLISNLGGVTGAILFNRFFSKHNYIFVFIATTILQVLGSIFDLIIVQRWNVYIGIPDHAMYLLGDSIVYYIVFVMSMMPPQILISRLCPRGTETIAFALLAGFSNAGTSMSVSIGSLLMENMWPVSARAPCNFSNVKWLIITGHLVTPLLIIPLCFFLLPHARICDRVDFDGNVIREEEEASEPSTSSPPTPLQMPGAGGDGEKAEENAATGYVQKS